jgi:hypothetical protein
MWIKKDFMKAFIIIALIAISSQPVFAEDLSCTVIANHDVLAEVEINVATKEQSNYINAGSFSFYVTNKGDSLFELEIFNTNGPTRSYAEGVLRVVSDKLAWTLWTRDILLETNCKLAGER